MTDFNTSTYRLTDSDVQILKNLIRKARISLTWFILLSICAPFVVPLLPSRYSHSRPFFDLSNYRMGFLVSAVCSVLFIFVMVLRYFSKLKAIKEDIADNTKQKLSTTIDNEKSTDGKTGLELFAGNLGKTRREIEDLQYFCSTLKTGDQIVIEYTTKSKTLLNLTKQ